MRHLLQVIMATLQQLHQISRRTRFKPVTAEFHFIKGIKQTERIVYTDGIFHKVITVVTDFQLMRSLLKTHFLLIGQFLQVFMEVIINLLLRYPA